MSKKSKETNRNEDSIKARYTDANDADMPAVDQPITEMLEVNYMPYAMA